MAESFDVVKWIRFAQGDYDSALVLSKIYRPNTEIACYLCQQSAEKILKAYLIAKGVSIKKTHDLSFLKNQCVAYDSDFDNYDKICNMLKAYIGAGRYPQSIDITPHHMKQALKDAEQILKFTKSKLKEMGYEYNPDDDVDVVASADAGSGR